MKSRKTISLTILVFAAILPLLLSAIFLSGRVVIRITMLQSLGEDKLTTIRIPEKEFRWYEKNREILVDGKMFDVKSIRLIAETFVVTGLFDDMETEMNALLKNFCEEANNNEDKTLSLYQVCLGLVAEEIPSDQVQLLFLSECKLFQSHYLTDLLNLSYRVITPPPELIHT